MINPVALFRKSRNTALVKFFFFAVAEECTRELGRSLETGVMFALVCGRRREYSVDFESTLVLSGFLKNSKNGKLVGVSVVAYEFMRTKWEPRKIWLRFRGACGKKIESFAIQSLPSSRPSSYLDFLR